ICGSTKERSIGGEITCSSLQASSKYWKTACMRWSMRSTTSRESLSCCTRFAATASAWARSCSRRNDRGARAMRLTAVASGASHAQELGKRGRAVGKPACPIHRERAQPLARGQFTQAGLADAIVNRSPHVVVDDHELIDAGTPAIARAGAGLASLGAPKAVHRPKAQPLYGGHFARGGGDRLPARGTQAAHQS